MPLILAIEPDRRQASQLTAMVRGRLHAELVLGESAERALAALGQRVPDLILTSALLSPKDESALGERLRTLDGAAAHVQTLTIPVLASGSGRGSGRAGGMLSALRRDKGKAAAAPEGCDPGVFAEQCKEYLERAATERASLAEKAATAALDIEAEAEIHRKSAASASSVVRPAPNRESKKAKTDHSSILLPKEPADEPTVKPYDEPIVKSYDEPVFAATDPYVAVAEEPVVAPRVDTPAPEPVVKRKGQKSGKKRQTGIRSVLGLGHDENDGPASLLAAVAALEAEEQVHVEAAAEPVVESAPLPEPPMIAAPAMPATAFESSIIRPPSAESIPLSAQLAEDARRAATPPEIPASEDILDLSSLLDRPAHAQAPQATTFSEDPAVEVYELDNSMLSTSFEDDVRPVTTSEPSAGTTGIFTSEPRTESRSWPVLDTLIAETTAFQSAPAPASSGPSATPPPADEAKPLGDILEALRRDAEQRPAAAPPPVPEMPEIASPSMPAAPSAAEPTAQDASDAAAEDAKKKKKRGKSSPAQDEWGFFDPDQCGFAALIEKLEEITDKDDPPPPRRA